MTFIRVNADGGGYLEETDDVLTSNQVKGALFVDQIEGTTSSFREEIPVVGFGEPVVKPL